MNFINKNFIPILSLFISISFFFFVFIAQAQTVSYTRIPAESGEILNPITIDAVYYLYPGAMGGYCQFGNYLALTAYTQAYPFPQILDHELMDTQRDYTFSFSGELSLNNEYNQISIDCVPSIQSIDFGDGYGEKQFAPAEISTVTALDSFVFIPVSSVTPPPQPTSTELALLIASLNYQNELQTYHTVFFVGFLVIGYIFFLFLLFGANKKSI